MKYIILSVILFALNNVLWKKNIQTVSIPFLISFRAVFTSFISFSILYASYDLNQIFSLPIARISLGSFLGVLGLFCMLIVIKRAPLKWIGIYSLLGILLTTIYLNLFESIPLTKSLYGIILIVIGFMHHLYEIKKSNQNIHAKQHLYLLIMIVSFGSSAIIHWKNLDAQVPAIFIILNQEFIVLIVASVITLSTCKLNQIKLDLKSNFWNVILMASVIFLALLFSFMGLNATNPLITSVLFLGNPLLTILFGFIFFKEKITFSNAISIGIIAVGSFIVHHQGV